MGGILFDLYFSFTSAKDFPNDLSVKIAKKIGLFLAFIAVAGILFSIMGFFENTFYRGGIMCSRCHTFL
ncbi:MAG: hypothetical protein IKS40_05485 [Treponema sp.]|nr:hypothetical protein [Treponema sp.]